MGFFIIHSNICIFRYCFYHFCERQEGEIWVEDEQRVWVLRHCTEIEGSSEGLSEGLGLITGRFNQIQSRWAWFQINRGFMVV